MQTLRLAMAVSVILGASLSAQSRPPRLAEGSITWLYYRDLPGAMRFYEDILGLTLTVDQGWAKVYQTSPTSFIGLVDESQGMHRASDTKPVAVAFVTADVDAWYAWLVGRGVRMRSPVADSKRLPIRGFTAYDPEGYTLEFETFRDHPQNATIRALLPTPK